MTVADIFFAIMTDRTFAIMTGMRGSLMICQCDIALLFKDQFFDAVLYFVIVTGSPYVSLDSS